MENKDELEKVREFTGDDNLTFIGIDDTFGFKCQQCGACCMNRNDIILNPFDIYKGAKYLGITPDKFLIDNCSTDLGCSSKIPIVLLASKENGFCPLLKFDIKDGGKFKCTIHPAKPGACSNHPIGTMYATNLSDGTKEAKYLKVSQCQNSISDEQQLVRDWVKPYLDHKDEIELAHQIQHLVTNHFDPKAYWFLLSFARILVKTTNDKNLEDKVKEAMYTYLSISIGLGYTNYDIDKPFIEQAENNIKELNEFYERTKTIMFEPLKKLFEETSGTTLEKAVENAKEFLSEYIKAKGE